MGLITTHSFESGVLEGGNVLNMQGRGSRGPGLRTSAVGQSMACDYLNDWSGQHEKSEAATHSADIRSHDPHMSLQTGMSLLTLNDHYMVLLA